MGEVRIPITSGDIQEVVSQIVERFHPQKVILFGSYARQDRTAKSDVDLLVIMETEERSIRQAADVAASIDHRFPIDILVRTPEQVEQRLEWGDCFITEVMSKGVVLYEALD